jgi:acetolactate synthase I/II/III large subunit
MPTHSGAQITIELLKRQGIETIAGIPGGANLPLYDALYNEPAIKHVLARHEQAAGFMAQGMARTTGKTAVCFATSGPGATNIFTAIADAKLDSIPIVCITGQVPSTLIGTDAFQEVDTYGMTIPITKHNFLVRSAKELLEVIPEAFRIAGSGRPGPVLIDIPKDVQMEQVTFDQWPTMGETDETPSFPEQSIRAAAEMINQAKSPIMYLGGGMIHSNASALALELIEKANIPATMTLMALGLIPHDHPLSIGMLGMHGARYTNLALEECDLLIVAGARFDDRATGKVSEFCPNAKVIHIDIDNGELDKLRTAHIGIQADVSEALGQLIPMIENTERTEWVARVNELKKNHPMMKPGLGNPMTAYGLIDMVGQTLGEDAIVSTDVGQHQMFTAQAYPFGKPRKWLTSGGLGTMGFGFPTAIGAALANPDKTVVCFSGDGSFLMNIQELATLAEENLNIKIILMNNNCLGLVHQQQELFYDKNIMASKYEVQVDFNTIAKGFGVASVDLGTSDDPCTTLKEALNTPGPMLIHVPLNVHEHVYPMVAPGGSNRHMIGGEANVYADA